MEECIYKKYLHVLLMYTPKTKKWNNVCSKKHLHVLFGNVSKLVTNLLPCEQVHDATSLTIGIGQDSPVDCVYSSVEWQVPRRVSHNFLLQICPVMSAPTRGSCTGWDSLNTFLYLARLYQGYTLLGDCDLGKIWKVSILGQP